MTVARGGSPRFLSLNRDFQAGVGLYDPLSFFSYVMKVIMLTSVGL